MTKVGYNPLTGKVYYNADTDKVCVDSCCDTNALFNVCAITMDNTPSLRWAYQTEGSLNSIAVADGNPGFVFVGGDHGAGNHDLFMFNADTGELIDSLNLDGDFYPSKILADSNNIYVLSSPNVGSGSKVFNLSYSGAGFSTEWEYTPTLDIPHQAQVDIWGFNSVGDFVPISTSPDILTQSIRVSASNMQMRGQTLYLNSSSVLNVTWSPQTPEELVGNTLYRRVGTPTTIFGVPVITVASNIAVTKSSGAVIDGPGNDSLFGVGPDRQLYPASPTINDDFLMYGLSRVSSLNVQIETIRGVGTVGTFVPFPGHGTDQFIGEYLSGIQGASPNWTFDRFYPIDNWGQTFRGLRIFASNTVLSGSTGGVVFAGLKRGSPSSFDYRDTSNFFTNTKDIFKLRIKADLNSIPTVSEVVELQRYSEQGELEWFNDVDGLVNTFQFPNEDHFMSFDKSLFLDNDDEDVVASIGVFDTT